MKTATATARWAMMSTKMARATVPQMTMARGDDENGNGQWAMWTTMMATTMVRRMSMLMAMARQNGCLDIGDWMLVAIANLLLWLQYAYGQNINVFKCFVYV